MKNEIQQDRIKDIAAMPEVINNTHSSCYRSYHILDLVLMMIDRGDSKETISMVVSYLWSVGSKSNPAVNSYEK